MVRGIALSTAVFALLLAGGLALQLRARRTAGAVTGGQALAAAMRTSAGRVTVFVLWLWTGVHFLAR